MVYWKLSWPVIFVHFSVVCDRMTISVSRARYHDTHRTIRASYVSACWCSLPNSRDITHLTQKLLPDHRQTRCTSPEKCTTTITHDRFQYTTMLLVIRAVSCCRPPSLPASSDSAPPCLSTVFRFWVFACALTGCRLLFYFLFLCSFCLSVYL